jgi:hypothetical protein
MINPKIPRVVSLHSVSNGKLNFVCSCGRIGSSKIKEFNRLTRCSMCELANARLINSGKYIDNTQIKELFTVIYKNGLYDFLNNL